MNAADRSIASGAGHRPSLTGAGRSVTHSLQTTRMPLSWYAWRQASGNRVVPGSRKQVVPFCTSSRMPRRVVRYSSSSVMALWRLKTWNSRFARSSGKIPLTAWA